MVDGDLIRNSRISWRDTYEKRFVKKLDFIRTLLLLSIQKGKKERMTPPPPPSYI